MSLRYRSLKKIPPLTLGYLKKKNTLSDTGLSYRERYLIDTGLTYKDNPHPHKQ